MTAWIDELFGQELSTKKGIRSSHDVLRGKKYVAIYFGYYSYFKTSNF
jgi:hypothetical protein